MADALTASHAAPLSLLDLADISGEVVHLIAALQMAAGSLADDAGANALSALALVARGKAQELERCLTSLATADEGARS